MQELIHSWCRNYLTQDMIRRILRDYFGYDVNFVMNVTDIEDKVCHSIHPYATATDATHDRSSSAHENNTSSPRTGPPTLRSPTRSRPMSRTHGTPTLPQNSSSACQRQISQGKGRI